MPFALQSRLRFLRGRPPEDDPTHLRMFSPVALRALLVGFENVQLNYVGGRYARLHARLFARDLVFSGLEAVRIPDVDRPETRFAWNGEAALSRTRLSAKALQTCSSCPGWVSNVELNWEHPMHGSLPAGARAAVGD